MLPATNIKDLDIDTGTLVEETYTKEENVAIEANEEFLVKCNKDGDLVKIDIPKILHTAKQGDCDITLKAISSVVRQIAEEAQGYVIGLLEEEGYNPDYSNMKGMELRMGILNMRFEDQEDTE